MLLAFAAATSAWAQQTAVPVDGMSVAQRADHRKLMRGYLDTFRILGRAKLCGLEFDADPFFRELALRHGENSEELRVAAISYKASAENLTVSPQISGDVSRGANFHPGVDDKFSVDQGLALQSRRG